MLFRDTKQKETGLQLCKPKTCNLFYTENGNEKIRLQHLSILKNLKYYMNNFKHENGHLLGCITV